MNKLFVWALVFLSASAGAQERQPVLSCPRVGSEYEEMVAKLAAIETSIRKDANCAAVLRNVRSLEDLVGKDRDQVLAIVEAANGESLNAEQSKTVRDYAENLTKKVASLNDLFTRSNQCFEGDGADRQLSLLAGFVGEASNLLATVSGPWGTPIAIAGNVVAGFMTGLDQVLKSRVGYDFSKRDQWKGYVQNLCTYHSYRSQIEHLLDPGAKITQMRTLKVKLDNQLGSMRKDCPQCEELILSYEKAKETGDSIAIAQVLQPQMAIVNSVSPKPYGNYIVQTLGLREWVLTEIERIQRESRGYWADASGRYVLYQAKNSIEQFLIQREAPRFMRFSLGQARGRATEFADFILDEGRPVYVAIDRLDKRLLNGRLTSLNWAPPMDMFKALVLQPIEWNLVQENPGAEDVQFSWLHFRDQGLDRLRNAQTSTQLTQTFCTFFKVSGLYAAELRAVCKSPNLADLVNTQAALADEMAKANVGPVLTAPFAAEAEEFSNSRLDALIKEIDSRQL
jgi:hypothetical protein